MKKLFTLCASALLAFTLSAQADQPQGTWYLGAGDATDLINIFGNGPIDIQPTLGYAVMDNLIIEAQMINTDTLGTGPSSLGTGQEGTNLWNFGAIYFVDGWGIGLHCIDIAENVLDERRFILSGGRMVMLNSISDHLYVYPNIQIDGDQNWESNIRFGFRF